jgi:archaellum component FlaC
MALPAYLMDQSLAKRIKTLEEQMTDVMEWINSSNDQYENLKQEIEKDVHTHVENLVKQIRSLEKEVESLKH